MSPKPECFHATRSADRLPTAIGIFNSVQGLSIATGPILGGLIVQNLGWRWTMFVNVPIAVVCLGFGLVYFGVTHAPRTICWA